jgi:hypothetical protein
MSKFGLFNYGDPEPLQTYDGDTLKSNPPYVTIVVYSTDGQSLREMAVIHLDKGQSVKVIEDGSQGYVPHIPGIRR